MGIDGLVGNLNIYQGQREIDPLTVRNTVSRILRIALRALVFIVRAAVITLAGGGFIIAQLCNLVLFPKVILTQLVVEGASILTNRLDLNTHAPLIGKGIRGIAFMIHLYFMTTLFFTGFPAIPILACTSVYASINAKSMLFTGLYGFDEQPPRGLQKLLIDIQLFTVGMWCMRHHRQINAIYEASYRNRTERILNRVINETEDTLNATTVSTLENAVITFTQMEDEGTRIDPRFLNLIRKVRRVKEMALNANNNDFLLQLNGLEGILLGYFDGKKVEQRNLFLLTMLKEGVAPQEEIEKMEVNLDVLSYDVPEIMAPNTNMTNSEMIDILEQNGNRLDVPLTFNASHSLTQTRLPLIFIKMVKRMIATLSEKTWEGSRENWGLLIERLNWGAEGCNDRLGACINEAYKSIFSEENICTDWTFEQKVHAEAQKLRDQIFEESWEQLKGETNVGDQASSKAHLREFLQDEFGVSYEPRGNSNTLGTPLIERFKEIFFENYTKERLLDHFSDMGENDETFIIPFQEIQEYLENMENTPFSSTSEVGFAIYDMENNRISRDAWTAILASLEYPLIH